jgi:16S rRNA (adenine1518-N6/adenine1519-N6)-dimethyltransferase
VEVDAALASGLRASLGPSGVEVVAADALTADLDALADGQEWLVAANLPYSVGTPILRRLVGRVDLFPVLVVMLQLEVAERLAAEPGDRRRGLLTFEIELAACARLLFTVPPSAFAPQPRVRSAVVRIDRCAERVDAALRRAALRLASSAFTQRRKKLSNALVGVVPSGVSGAAMEAAGIEAASRAEDLSRGQWLALAAALGEGGSEA